MHSSHTVHDDVMLRKYAYVLIGQLVLSLVVGACSSAESTRTGPELVSPPAEAISPDRPEPTEKMGPPADVVLQLIQEALRAEGNVSYTTLRQHLGPPDDVEAEPVANQYVEGQIDTLRTLVYTGLRALMYDVTDDTKTFLVRLSVSSTQYATPEGLHVGLSEKQVLDELGPPTRRNSSQGELIYQESGSMPTSMVVRVRDGRVVRIDWEFSFG